MWSTHHVSRVSYDHRLMVVLQWIVHTDVMHGANDDRPGPRGSASTPRASAEIGDGRLTLVSSRPHGHGEVPPPQQTARTRSRRRRPLSRLSNATLIGLACAGSIGAVGAVNASLFPSLGHPTSESVWQNPGKVPAAAHAIPSPRAERVVVVDPTFALVVGVGPADGSAGAAIESTSTEPAPPSTLDAIGAAQPPSPRAAVTSGSSGSGSGSGSGPGSGSAQGITTSIVPTSSSPTVDSPDHVTPSTPGTSDDHDVDGPDTTADTTADTTPSATDDSTPSDTTDPASGGTPSGGRGSGRDGSGSGKSGQGG